MPTSDGILQISQYHRAVLEGMRHKQDLAHFVQTVIRPLFNTRSPRRLLTATIGFVLFSYFASPRLNPVVIRYCVINLAPFQEITNAFIISKNGFVHARYCTLLHCFDFVRQSLFLSSFCSFILFDVVYVSFVFLPMVCFCAFGTQEM
jgi:hypothetical protein